MVSIPLRFDYIHISPELDDVSEIGLNSATVRLHQMSKQIIENFSNESQFRYGSITSQKMLNFNNNRLAVSIPLRFDYIKNTFLI